MRHKTRTRRLSRRTGQRKALLSSLMRNLIINERISTTVAKAKEARRRADELITLGKRRDINARRSALAILKDRGLVKVLFDETAPRFKSRNGGYTRMLRTSYRAGDGAEMVILELVEKRPRKEPEPKKKKKAKKPGAEAEAEEAPPAGAPPAKEEPIKKMEEKEEKKPVEDHKKKKQFLGGFRKFFQTRRKSEGRGGGR